MDNKNLKKQIAKLKEKLTGDMTKDMDVREEIHRLTMIINGTKPTSQEFECVGCGS
tara:strand:+ start:609 stop:776 length:168 start_codon:yes stop_codon:yes gene_type:complete